MIGDYPPELAAPNAARWVELGRDVAVDARTIIALHTVYPNRRVAWAIAPRRDNTRFGTPKTVAVTERGLLIPVYVTKAVALARLRGDTEVLTQTHIPPSEVEQRLDALHTALRDALRSHFWPDRSDLSDDALTILSDVADAIHDIHGGGDISE